MNFVKKNLVSLVGTFLLFLTNLVISIFLARGLSPTGVGQYAIIISAVTIIGALATLGIGAASIYYINNRGKDVSVVSTVSAAYSMFAGLLVMILLGILLRYEPYFGYLPTWLIWTIGFYAAGLICVEVLYPIFVANLEVLKFKIIQLLPRVVLLCLVIAMIAGRFFNINLALAATAVGQFFGIIVVLWFLRKTLELRACFDWRLLKCLISYGLKLNLSYVILLLNGEIGILLIRYFLQEDFAEVGYYSRALRLAALVMIIATGIGPLLYAKWSSAEQAEKQLQVERVSRVFFLISILGLTVLIIFARQIIGVLYGQAFLPAAPIMQVLSIGVAANFLQRPHFRLFSASGKPLLTSLVLVISLATMIILMIVLIPKYFGIGAGVAFAFSNIVSLVATYLLSWHYFNVRFSKSILITRNDIQYLREALMGKMGKPEIAEI